MADEICSAGFGFGGGGDFFFNLYVHIWNGAIIYLPLLFLGLYGSSPVKTVCGLLLVLLLINLICPYCIVLYFLFMALSLVAFFTGLFGFILNLGKQ